MSEAKYPLVFVKTMAREAREKGQSTLDAIRTYEKSIEKNLRELEKIELETADETKAEYMRYRVQKGVEGMYEGFMRSFVALSSFVSVPFSFGGLLPKEEYLPAHMELEKRIEGIFVYVDGECIMLRTPLLPNRKHDPMIIVTRKDGKKFPLTKTEAFCREIGRAMDNCKEFQDLPMERYERKTLFYLHVINDQKNMVDNDNRDTRNLTNEVCARFLGGDAPTRCRMIHDSVWTTKIPEGTYLTVYPQGIKEPKNEEIVSFWEKKFVDFSAVNDTNFLK